MLNDDTHAQHICISKRVVLFRFVLFLLNACLDQNLYSIKVQYFFPGAIIPVHLSLNVI